ncbi:MAG TPA: signal recognition particle-docking protein FtsY [Candidatus Babeliales bacterium]|jgi:fused signal recognition particle receptor|nr:signal recognition particle-docking protein FtsY [Candidatus Babeliales bacterium]
MFNFIKNKLQKIFSTVTSKLGSFFNRTTIDEVALKELEIVLISSDVGVATTRSIIAALRKQIGSGVIDGAQLKVLMHRILLDILMQHTAPDLNTENVFLFVGINGSGKTTSIGKLAYHYTQQGKKVLLVAADTFRAAAPEQLNQWALQTGADILMGKEGQDPASLVFQGCEKFKHEHYDILIIDTAGRLQTKINLMHELAKIKRCVQKQLAHQNVVTLLTIDAMLGQNSFEQAKLFKESTDVTGIILTKMDGTGKGGTVFAIAQELSIPVVFITFGEQSDQIKKFNVQEYVTELLG